MSPRCSVAVICVWLATWVCRADEPTELAADDSVRRELSEPIETAAGDPVYHELRVWSDVREAALRDAYDKAVAALSGAAAELDPLRDSPGALIAKRAVAACGWLQDSGDYERASILAQKALELLADYGAVKTSTDIERAYWQAILMSRFAEKLEPAIRLVETAREQSPEEPRLLELENEMLGAAYN